MKRTKPATDIATKCVCVRQNSCSRQISSLSFTLDEHLAEIHDFVFALRDAGAVWPWNHHPRFSNNGGFPFKQINRASSVNRCACSFTEERQRDWLFQREGIMFRSLSYVPLTLRGSCSLFLDWFACTITTEGEKRLAIAFVRLESIRL